GLQLGRRERRVGRDLRLEERALLGEHRGDARGRRALRRRGARTGEPAGAAAPEGDRRAARGGWALAARNRSATPDDLAAQAQLVEELGPVVGHARRQDLRLPRGDRRLEALELR